MDSSNIGKTGGVFVPLQDPNFFARVKLGDNGRYVEWPGALDFCEDALWEQAHGKPLAS